MKKGQLYDLSAQKVGTTMFGTRAEHITELRTQDQLFDELVEDYLTVATALQQIKQPDKEADRQFWMDSLETLHALDAEIRAWLSRVD